MIIVFQSVLEQAMIAPQSPCTLCLQMVNAGKSSNMGVDNVTGCLPDVWQFCEPRPTGHDTNLMCPSVAYRRPVQTVANKLVQVFQLQPQETTDCILTFPFACVPVQFCIFWLLP